MGVFRRNKSLHVIPGRNKDLLLEKEVFAGGSRKKLVFDGCFRKKFGFLLERERFAGGFRIK